MDPALNQAHPRTRRLLLPFAVAYMAVVVALMAYFRIGLTPDLLLLALVPVGILSGRLNRWLADWIPFVVLLVAWQGMRAFATHVGLQAHNLPLHGERILFAGNVPTVLLQRWLDHGWWSPALDTVTSWVYIAHFAMVVAVGLVLWIGNRSIFARYVVALLGMAMAAFVVYLVFPTTPPWLDTEFGFLPGVHRILLAHLPAVFGPVYSQIDPNEFAAFPSMHAAFPFLGWLAIRRWNPLAGRVMLAWTLMVWFTVVYLGEHFVVDVIAGAAFAYVAWRVTGWLTQRRPAEMARWDPRRWLGEPEAVPAEQPAA